MKVLLVQPPLNPNIIGAGILYLNEPLALETIAACLPHHDVKILDMRLESNLEQELKTFQPDVVGITGYTTDVYTVSRILGEVKGCNSTILTVAGGRHATIMPQDFNKEFIDVIVIGEGNYSFRELVDTYQSGGDLKKINGLALHNNGKLFFTRHRPPIMNLDETPLPARNLTRQHRNKYFRASWRPVASMMTSRGCPYRCNFCDVWKREDGKYRTRSPERVIRELESIEELYVSIADDNFMQELNRTEKAYKMIKERSIKKTYKLIGRSDVIIKRPDIIEKWKKIGLELMVIGIESFRDEELQALNKHSSVRNNEEAIHILHENNVTVSAQFIIRPDYSEEDFDALAEYVQKMKLTNPMFSVLTPLPGTDLFEETKEQLLTHNYEMFDLVHSVLPTKLPRKKFYQCYTDLLRKCYPIETTKKRGSSLLTRKVINQLSALLSEAHNI